MDPVGHSCRPQLGPPAPEVRIEVACFVVRAGFAGLVVEAFVTEVGLRLAVFAPAIAATVAMGVVN